MKTKTDLVAKIVAKLREARKPDGTAEISDVDTATLLRARLRREFPTLKISVRKAHYSCLHVRYSGDWDKRIDDICRTYDFGGFDGMIDLAYSKKRWLFPDGNMEFASSDGTAQSRGSVPAEYTDCPRPGAILIQYGPKYIFAQPD
jgi:hypothetical protein